MTYKVDYYKIFPGIPTGNFTGFSNVSSICEKELR
ncbi:hypothetical protein SLEP1_g58646 [Rubroshorea leprosula]|uniref:Uncharacterized protein n=1 Tax=Rubroshorea leprosula TaxID=152421 RepID=A0AAV5MR00_9ROSI|nr:hypothetical protein SLEP1_g58646 [Rubroshorea leprosula]